MDQSPYRTPWVPPKPELPSKPFPWHLLWITVALYGILWYILPSFALYALAVIFLPVLPFLIVAVFKTS